ncbi:GvpL/GvpF family gas vesicle protein [Kitasatospora sp. NPDC048365]|uniref:GvpL/GvpF family gas vesicle protein n=1 Tax=Kitasatospora sp. NPDC048365 TaxID=3364050 RepID=UPI00371F0566
MTSDTYTWLYAIGPAATDRPHPGSLSGVAGERPRLLTSEGLAAVVGSVPASDFDTTPLHQHLEDPRWLEAAVRAHHRVIDVLARSSHALPLRFATLYHDDQRVLGLLHQHRSTFHAALERIAGRTEWGVKGYLDTTRLPPDDDTGTPSPERPGTAYLLRRRAARDRAGRALDDAAERAGQIHRRLAEYADEATEHPLQSPEVTAVRDPMVLNGAYLVDRSRAQGFADLLADLRQAHTPALRVELTGPWPPYSFVELPIADNGR